MKTDKIEISKELLKHLFALTRIQVVTAKGSYESEYESVYYTLYDNEYYSSIDLTVKQGMEMLELKEAVKELEDERN